MNGAMRQLAMLDPMCRDHMFHPELVRNALPYMPPPSLDWKAPVPFVILARPRTGSNFLVHTLREHHPRVRCDGEAMHPAGVYAAAPLNWTVAERDANRVEYLSRLLSKTQWPPGQRAVVGVPPASSGFKAFTHHLTRSEFVGLTSSPLVRKIVLRRANVLDEYISELKAIVVAKYLDADTSHVTVTVDAAEFKKFVHKVESEEKCIDAARRHSTESHGGDDWLSIVYEDMVHPNTMAEMMQGALNHILPAEFRKVDKERPKKTLSKQDTTMRNASISNFRDLCTALRPMPRFFAMLVEGLDAANVCPE